MKIPETAEEVYADLSRRNPFIIGNESPWRLGQIVTADNWRFPGGVKVALNPPISLFVLRVATKAEYVAAVGRQPPEEDGYFYEVSTD